MSSDDTGASSGTPPTHILLKVALYRGQYGNNTVAEEGSWVTGDTDYAQVSEWIEIQFPLLAGPDFVRAQLEALDARELKLNTAHLAQLKAIQDARRQLLALPAPEHITPVVAEQSLHDIPF